MQHAPIEHHYDITQHTSPIAFQVRKPWMTSFQQNLPKLPSDPLSNAQPEKAVTTHLVWDVAVDFSKKEFTATARYSFLNQVTDNTTLILDTSNLVIEEILVNKAPVSFTIIPSETAEKPDALHIPIPPAQGAGDVTIKYRTTQKATGIFWVDPEFTEGGKYPLVYTLFEPTEGASAIPGQHSPQVRLTYEVNVQTGNSEFLALSSVSNNPTVNTATGEYRGLAMTRAVPLYLLSLHVGHFTFRPFDHRTGVYAEHEMIETAHQALQKLPDYLEAAESLCGPYNWGVYTPIQLGWPFPFGAMEHPCASTLGGVAYERPSIVPHELAHSWTGNDITNCNWQQFFWNEGATTFLEYRICEKIWGTDFASMVFISLLKKTAASVEYYKKANPEILKLCAHGTNHEFSTIPYAKGALFFFTLQKAIGADAFDQFFKDYMSVFYQNTMSDERFLAFLKHWLQQEQGINDFDSFIQKHQIFEWLYGTSTPSNAPEFHSQSIDAIDNQIQRVLSSQPVDKDAIQTWDIVMQGSFLNLLSGRATKDQIEALDHQLHYTQSKKVTIQGEWILVCIEAGYLTPEIENLVISYMIKRNSAYDAARICTLLNQAERGKLFIQRILDETEGKLFPLTRNTIQNKLSENQK